ncbi:MOSC domain-containing protein [Cellulophaga baltica]|uniref:MOSC domain-containing protein n=1 Tax=Cellulophaga baltica TaxID=76594 RepID=UPI002148E004|nr:MOSC domain-containing protein [Cellulophaga baltica]MCR1026104.1 MOSC domain-containing protein [Cellulophaga baltica]
MKVEQLYTYHLKSGRGRHQTSVKISETGFSNDRTIAILDVNNKVITGRDYPQLLGINSTIRDNILILNLNALDTHRFILPELTQDTIAVKLFRNTVLGHLFKQEANELISDFLQGQFRLVYIGNYFRPLLKSRGGKDGDTTGYADSSPVHLINLKTLQYLNTSLKEKVTTRHFRPNIVVDGNAAFEEDSWAIIEINGIRFRLQEKTQRCIFTTIDPNTYKKSEKLQPLSSIAAIRAKFSQRPTFGIGLVPSENGTIAVEDKIKIMETL